MLPRPVRLRLTLLIFLAGLGAIAARADFPVPFDADWRFHLGDAPGAEAPGWDDSGWRKLDLPHDWSIELPPAAAAPAGGAGGFFPTGVGWYRKRFKAPADWRGLGVSLEFDGVSRHGEVWLNGRRLGRRPAAAVPFRFDLAPHLRIGAENVIAVRVDHSAQPAAGHYTGSGITRRVRLSLTPPLHLVPDSVVITTLRLAAERAEVQVTAQVRNAGTLPQTFTVESALTDPAGKAADTAKVKAQAAPGATAPVTLTLRVKRPQAWSPDSPALYTAVTRLLVNKDKDEGDRLAAFVGLRTVQVSPGRGFELNGQPLELVGGNTQADNGLLGAAAFDHAEFRRAAVLKAAGFNAVRTARHPPSPAFLDACDRLGLLVIVELFDGWKEPKQPHDYGRDFDGWWRRDLDALLQRDRNHPSVVLWSLGHDPAERDAPAGADLARRLAARVRELDPTRPVTVALGARGPETDWTALDPVFAAVDVAGYDHALARHAADHARQPARVILGTAGGPAEIFAHWVAASEQPYVIGDFAAAAQDRLGGIDAAGPGFPRHGCTDGEVDAIGFRRPASHYRAIVWNRGERLYAAVRAPGPDGGLRESWTWPGSEGRELEVEVYSRHEAVRLYLNDDLVGERPTTRAEEFRAVFTVPYAAGTLRAAGVAAGEEVQSFTLETAGAPAAIRLTADRDLVRADGHDLAYLGIEVVDAAGRVVPSAAVPVTVKVTGPAVVAALGSSDLRSTEPYPANPRRTHEGRALAVIRTQPIIGHLTVTASAPGLTPGKVVLRSAR
ncbi:MAG: DUF4982 domain-containing protein [Opitutaceae bacterium]|nr:DUF4982 domain-containing protein [Opitutaceae bacterium]